MAFEDFAPTLASLLGEVSGIEAVHYPHPDQGDGDLGLPGKLSAFPCFVIVPVSGTQMFGGPKIAITLVDVTLYVVPGILPEAYGTAIQFHKRIRDKIASRLSLGLTSVQHAIPAPGNFFEGPGSVTYNDVPHIGVKYHLEIKESETFTVAA